MKKRIIYVAILSAMICATILSGCNNTEVTSNDTEPVTTTSAVITTVAPTTKATETAVAPTTESETTVAQTEAETEPQDTEAQTEASKVETEKPETNKPSSNTNSGGNTTSSQKPAQDTNNNTSNDNKPSNNSQTVTDDTPIPHSQLCTDANMSKITSAVNTYFVNLGMTHNPSLNKDNSGWFLTQTNLVAYSECSVNNFMNDTIVSFNNEADAFGSMYGVTYSDWTFNCYAEKQANGEYNIYFCHE